MKSLFRLKSHLWHTMPKQNLCLVVMLLLLTSFGSYLFMGNVSANDKPKSRKAVTAKTKPPSTTQSRPAASKPTHPVEPAELPNLDSFLTWLMKQPSLPKEAGQQVEDSA